MGQVTLNGHEARLLGVLIEKEMTTPEQYPLSLNAATVGCNQKSNRHPVLEWSEAEVHVGLQGLVMKQLAGGVVPAGSRVEKFRHNARQRLELGNGPLVVLAELMMRGPQAPGELRTRASRMFDIPTQEALSQHLVVLATKGCAKRLEPGAGSRVERWVQTLCADLHPLDDPAPALREHSPSRGGMEPRVEELERRVAQLEARLERLARELGA